MKVNVVARIGDGRTGYRGVLIERDVVVRAELEGPEGLRVDIAPRTTASDRLSVHLAVPDLGVTRDWFGRTLGWDVVADDVVRVGETDVLIGVDSWVAASPTDGFGGWTYLTVQVHDAPAEVEAVLDKGGALVVPLRDLGDVARFAIVADPFGNQLEISQRASLTGPLGPMPIPRT